MNKRAKKLMPLLVRHKRKRSPSPRLYHCTPFCNFESILGIGIMTNFAKGRRKVVWLCDECKIEWAVEHVAVKHGVSVNEVAVLQVRVSRNQLKRERRGLWTSSVDISADLVGYGSLRK